ncbi:MAG: hypothetical protein ACPGSC_14100, partial [Granulosicoccaceae bacterium]
MLKLRRAIVFALAISSANVPAASRLHAPEAISAAAEDFLRAYPFESKYPVEFELNPLSNRLRLAYCSDPIKIEFSQNAKRYG